VNNGNGTWTYTPALNDFTAVSFSYTITDGSLSAAAARRWTSPGQRCTGHDPVTLVAIAEDSGARVITQPSCWPTPATSTGEPDGNWPGDQQRLGHAGEQRQRHLDLYAGVERRQQREFQLHDHRRSLTPRAARRWTSRRSTMRR